MGGRRYRRQERSLEQRVREHCAKVEEERMRSVPNQGLIRYWEREVRAFEAGIKRARRRQRRRR